MREIPTGPEIEAERERLGLTAGQLARLAGMKAGVSHLRKIERGLIEPKAVTLRAIVGVLKREEERNRAARISRSEEAEL